MATVKAVIRKSKKNSRGECLVFIQYGHDGKSTVFTTKVKVKPAHWNDRKQLVDSTKGVKGIVANKELIKSLKADDTAANAWIGKQAADIRQLSWRLMQDGVEPTIYALKLAHKRFLKGKDIRKGSFFDLFQEYLDDNKHKLRPATLNGFGVLKSHLKSFEKSSGRSIVLESIDRSLVNSFLNYLVEKTGVVNETTNSYLKKFKTLLKHLYDEKYLVDNSFERVKSLKTPKDQEKEIIYVAYDEFEKIRNKDLSTNPRLEKVRDLFILGCSTGLRFGDLVRITPNHINGNFIEITTEKTSQKLSVPINQIAAGIFKKYNNHPPQGKEGTISNQKFNKYLKELAKISELDTIVTKIVFKGNEAVEYAHPKHELISSHSMRRTFITLGKKVGMTTETIMKIVGHSSYDMTKKYQEIDKESMEAEMKLWDSPVMKVAGGIAVSKAAI